MEPRCKTPPLSATKISQTRIGIMLRKRSFPFYRAFPLGLFLCVLVGVAPVFGQDNESLIVEKGFQVNALAGPCFHSGATRASCALLVVQLEWTGSFDQDDRNNLSNFLRFKPGSSLPSRFRVGDESGPTGINVAATVAYGSDDMIPDPPCPLIGCGPPEMLAKQSARAGDLSVIAEDPLISDQRYEANHRGVLIGLLEFGLPIPIVPKFIVKPYVGFGYAYVREGEAKAPNQFAVASQGMASLSYGLGVSVRISERVDFLVQTKSIVFFADSYTYIDPEGQRFAEEYSTVATSSLLFGFALRLPKPRN